MPIKNLGALHSCNRKTDIMVKFVTFKILNFQTPSAFENKHVLSFEFRFTSVLQKLEFLHKCMHHMYLLLPVRFKTIY